MDSKTIREVNELMEIADTLSSIERRLLFNLDEKGPGLLMELAVRTLHFPEEVSKPLADLRSRGLIQSDAFEGGQFGNELIYLSKWGDQLIALLREEEIHPSHHVDHGLESMSGSTHTRSVPEHVHAPDLRQQEVELLKKLGELEERSGNADEARKHYQEALNLARGIATTSSSSETNAISHTYGAGTISAETSATVQAVSVPPELMPCTEDALEDLPNTETKQHNE